MSWLCITTLSAQWSMQRREMCRDGHPGGGIPHVMCVSTMQRYTWRLFVPQSARDGPSPPKVTCHTKELPFITFPANDLFPYIQKQIKTYVSKTDFTWFFLPCDEAIHQVTACVWVTCRLQAVRVCDGKGHLSRQGHSDHLMWSIYTLSCVFCLFFYPPSWTVNWVNLKLWQEHHRQSEWQIGHGQC